MSKTREDLLISPGQPISSPNCWWAACSKADKYCGDGRGHFYALISRMWSIRIWQGSQNLATRLLFANHHPQQHHHWKPWICALQMGYPDDMASCHVFTNPVFRNPLSSLRSLATSDSHGHSQSTNMDRGMPLRSYTSLTSKLSGRNGNSIVWSQYNDSGSGAVYTVNTDKYKTQRDPKVKTE